MYQVLNVGVQTGSITSVARLLGLESEVVIDPDAVSSDSYEMRQVPGGFTAYIIHEDPEIWLIPHLLSDGETAHIIQLAEGRFSASEVYTFLEESFIGETKYFSLSMYRRSHSADLGEEESSPTITRIRNRLSCVVQSDEDHLEALQVVRYGPGQYFAPHNDGLNRERTVFIYLSDLPEDSEGETCFPVLGFKVTPRKGCALVWWNYTDDGKEDVHTVHQGLPPTAGVKYGLNCWFSFDTVESDGTDTEGSM